MARLPPPAVDPARDSAALLRRVGFLILLLGLPFGALLSAPGLVIAAAISLALICTAATLDDAARPVRDNVSRLATSPVTVALAVLAGWSTLSLLWTPSPGPTASRLVATLMVVAVALAGYLALPDRMRSANLYLAPIGAAAAALAVAALAAFDDSPPEGEADRYLERGVCVLVLYAWPAIAWLRSRGRDGQAIGLAAAVAVAAALGPEPAAALSFAAGAVLYGLVQLLGRRGADGAALLLALALLLAPLLVVLGLHGAAAGRFPQWAAAMEGWRTAILQDPARLLTGHGLGSFRRGVTHSLAGGPVGTPALVLWYDLGIVGVGAAAFALWAWIRAAAGHFGPLLPGLVAAFATGLALTLSGLDRGETWWPAAVAVVALVFVAAERGQFRTKRPKALSFGRKAAAPAGERPAGAPRSLQAAGPRPQPPT
ncbi:peptide ABC transporter permease [Enterovirga sp.]|uniref:peptide ABC transporter permease n=1 Tax=Enterovirga sp. TaxID=2026350 RepID=UPI0026075021|nr:peptide ABC transporter permease [Enterovirga sp.]MDB5589640.1 peptide transporter permease [Enterovirga sp.]